MLQSPIRLSRGRYAARLACGEADLQAAQRLRCQIFRGTDGLDQDAFDVECQHVLVEEVETGQLTCCFRMMVFENGRDVSRSYAAQFYDLGALSAFEGSLIEIGRFCVASDALDPDILRVAWGAIAAQVGAQDVRMLFGCSSFNGTAEEAHLEAFSLLKDAHLAPKCWMPKVKAADVFPFAEALKGRKPDLRAAVKGLPPLLRTYLAMGGWVSDHAVVDADLNTLHVFTGVEIAAIPPSRAKALRAVGG